MMQRRSFHHAYNKHGKTSFTSRSLRDAGIKWGRKNDVPEQINTRHAGSRHVKKVCIDHQ
jgi:hypothetical protein